MEQENFVSIQEMKNDLMKFIGATSPLKITRNDGKTMLCYIRGFADQQSNILLLSDTPNSVGLKILEVKHIRSVKYSQESNGIVSSKTLHAKRFKKVLYFF